MTQPALRPTYPIGLPSLAAILAFLLIVLTSTGRATAGDAQGSATAPGIAESPGQAVATPDPGHPVQQGEHQWVAHHTGKAFWYVRAP